MLVLNEKCSIAKRIRKVEEVLRDNGIMIGMRGDGLLITVDDKDFVMVEGETASSPLMELPSETEPTLIRKLENYIVGK